MKLSSKAERWKLLEQQLIDGGWYTGTEQYPVAGSEMCYLWED